MKNYLKRFSLPVMTGFLIYKNMAQIECIS
jgi:hypothetical protein